MGPWPLVEPLRAIFYCRSQNFFTRLSVDDHDHNHDQQRNRECVRYFTLHHNRLTIELVTVLKP